MLRRGKFPSEKLGVVAFPLASSAAIKGLKLAKLFVQVSVIWSVVATLVEV